MKILNNLTGRNHMNRVLELFNDCDEVVIASPFLMPDYTDFLNSLSIQHGQRIEIITTLPPESIEQIRNVNSLLSFCQHPMIVKNNIEVVVSINNRLHGKVYIFKNPENQTAIITSANFTQNGLVKNHEWGLEFSDANLIETIKHDLFYTIEKRGITLTELQNLYEACKAYQNAYEIPSQKIKLKLISLLPTDTSIVEFPEKTNFWIKPIGVTGDPVPLGQKFDSLEEKLNFSTKRKPNVKVGDVLICYGVGAKQILSIYRVEEPPAYETKEEMERVPWLERWAWYVVGKNLTPNYGKEWWKHNLNAFELMTEFKQLHRDIPITNNGGDTLGGLNYGHDKLNLKREFAEFIIGKVIAINRQTK